MKTLLVALGILASFGALFWLDRYYRNDGESKEGENAGQEEHPGESTEAPTEPE